MKKIIIGALASILSGSITVCLQPPLLAMQNRIPASVAQGKTDSSPTLEVSPFGITLSFEDLKESIEKYWAADSSYLRVGTNAPLGPEANILFLKTVGKPTSNSVGTTLTVQTKDTSGIVKTYSFLVKFTRTQPKSAIVRIYADDKSVPKSSSTVFKPLSSSPSQVPEVPNNPMPNLSASPTPVIGAAQTKNPDQATLNATRPNPLLPKAPIPDFIGQDIKLAERPNPTPSKAPMLPARNQSRMKPYSVVPHAQRQPSTAKPKAVAPKPKTASSQPKAVVPKAVSSKAVPAPAARPTLNIASILSAHAQANALIRGLSVANKTGEVGSNSDVTKKVQSVVLRLRRGESMGRAIQIESVEQKTISRLLQLGNYQPVQ